MFDERAVRQKDRGSDDLEHPAEGKGGQHHTQGARANHKDCDGQYTGAALCGGMVEPLIKRADCAAHHDSGMRRAVPQPFGFAQCCVQRKG